MLRRSSLVLLSVISSLAFGCAADVPGPGRGEGPIIDAPPVDGAHASVVAVSSFLEDEHVFCTGLVVGPYAVLTPTECLGDAETTEVMLGEDARYAERLAVDSIVRDDLDGALALVVMQQPLPVEEAVLSYGGAREPELSVVGYGLGGGGASILGVKREASFEDYDGAIYSSDEALCFGDRGAALIDGQGQVIGLATDIQTICRPGERQTSWTALTRYEAFIAQGQDMIPTCGSATGC